MTDVLTEDEIAVGDVVSTQLEKMWGWYLAGGIIAMIFGFFVISYRHASVYAIVYLASGFFIAVGLLEIIGGLRAARQRWPLLIFGVIWIAAGIVGFVWPHITIFIVAVLVGWGFLVLGHLRHRQLHPLPLPALLVGLSHPRHHRRRSGLPLHPSPRCAVDRVGRAHRHRGHPVRRRRAHRRLLGPARHEALGSLQGAGAH